MGKSVLPGAFRVRVLIGAEKGRGFRQTPEIFRMYALGGQQIVFRKVEILCVESTEEEGRLKKVTELLSEGVYACLKQNTLVRKQSPLRGSEN